MAEAGRRWKVGTAMTGKVVLTDVDGRVMYDFFVYVDSVRLSKDGRLMGIEITGHIALDDKTIDGEIVRQKLPCKTSTPK